MLLAIVFFNVWGVLQLVALGSFARTVRVRTVLVGIVGGLFFCAPFAAVLEHTWAAAIAALTGSPIEAVIAVTGYTVDPPIEEIIRVLPLAFLLLVPVIRRQISVTDCVLIGAAAGAGFGLAEDLYRFGTAPQHATAVPGGWSAPFQSPIVESASGRYFIPSIGTALNGWLPDMGGFRLFGLSAFMLPNLLLIWSSLAGLAVGLWLRLEGPARWIAAAALFAYAASAHAANNADITFGRQLLVTAPFRALSVLQPLMPIAALAIAWWIDRRRQGDVAVEHLLAAEQQASPRAFGTWRAAVARMPESILWVERFVRLRRAYNTERLLGGAEAENLRAAISDVRNEINCQLRRPGSWRVSMWAWTDHAWRVLRQPTTIVWIVLSLPSTLWFVVGGWPATAGVQRLLSDGAPWWLVVALTVVGQAWMALGMLAMLRSWRRLLHLPIGDPGAAVVLSLVGGAGALGFGVSGSVRAFGPSPLAPAHVLDAIKSATLGNLIMLANLAAALGEWLRRVSDVHLPIPFTKDKFYTPEGPWKDAINSILRNLIHHSGPLGNALEIFGGRFGGPVPQLNYDSDDPNNWNRYVAPLATLLAFEIFGGATIGPEVAAEGARGIKGTPPRVAPTPEATQPGVPPRSPLADSVQVPSPQSPVGPPGGSAPVDPFAVTQPSPGLGSPVPMSVLQRESPSLNRLGPTQPAPSPMAKSVDAPAPHPGLAETVPASARDPVPEGMEYLKPGDTLKIDDP